VLFAVPFTRADDHLVSGGSVTRKLAEAATERAGNLASVEGVLRSARASKVAAVAEIDLALLVALRLGPIREHRPVLVLTQELIGGPLELSRRGGRGSQVDARRLRDRLLVRRLGGTAVRREAEVESEHEDRSGVARAGSSHVTSHGHARSGPEESVGP